MISPALLTEYSRKPLCPTQLSVLLSYINVHDVFITVTMCSVHCSVFTLIGTFRQLWCDAFLSDATIYSYRSWQESSVGRLCESLYATKLATKYCRLLNN